MLSDWQAFLRDAGAVFADGVVEHFGDLQQEMVNAVDGDIMADLSHFGLLRVGGADARDFLQGQFTNDVRQVSDDHSQLSGYCSPKGRILTLFRLFRRGDAYYLRMPAPLLAPTLERLRKYILMSKVTLDDAGDDLLRIGLSGPHAIAALAGQLDRLPTAVDEVARGNDLTVIRVAGPHPRVEVYGPASAIRALWQAMTATAKPAGARTWALLDIHAAVPTVYPETVEAFVPQMVNLQLVDGVSFRKGCYTGQEVVARMQFLGKLKRRMYRAHIDGDTAPRPGDDLYCAYSESGQGAGKVVDAQPAPRGGYDLLAVVQVSLLDEGYTILLRDEHGAQLRFEAMPYPFPQDEEEQQQAH